MEKLPDAEAVEYFHSRPRKSQFSACVSNQSSVIASREVGKLQFFMTINTSILPQLIMIHCSFCLSGIS